MMTPLARAAVLILILGLASARGAAPPARLTAEQVAWLKERDRLWALLQKQAREGQLIGAQRTCRRVLAVRHQVFGSLHGQVQDTLVLLARLCEARGDWKAALEARREAAAIQGRLWGEGHWKAADARREATDAGRRSRMTEEQRQKVARAAELNNALGRLYGQGKASQATPLARQALRLYKEVLGERHPDYALSLNNLSGLYQAMGEHGKALPLYLQARELYRKVQGEKHPHYATSLTNLVKEGPAGLP
jgi:tetratricopeptide (TPR) repeat protein